MLHSDGPTLNIGIRRDGTPLELPLHLLDTHCQVLAPTGYGKSRLLARMTQELVSKTPDATVFLDPAGDCVNHLRRWAHENGYGHRLVVIDPRERRLICGLNPIRPWSQNRGLQAGVLRDVVRRSLGGHETSANAPLAGQWIYNTLYALLECGLTMHELPFLLDYTNSSFRDAVVGRLGPSLVKNEFQWLAEAHGQSGSSQGMRLLNEQLGSTTRRLRQFVLNDNLVHMLAGRINAIDWNWVIDRGKLVLVNLGLEENALTDEDQRLVGQMVVSSVTRHSFARPAHRRRPVNLIIDEAGKLASPEVTTILNEGRKFRLRLVLAHQTLSQLVNHADNDTTLLDAVTNNARLKIVFGGLGAKDAADVGQTLYGHLADPYKQKLKLKAPTQLSRVAEAVSRTVGESRSEAWSRAHSTSRARSTTRSTTSGFSTGHAASLSAGRAAGLGISHSTGPDIDMYPTMLESESSFYGSGEGDFEGSSESESASESVMEAETDLESESESSSASSSVTRGLMVVPGEPFEVTTSVQFESLEEQLHRCTSRMIRQPDRHAILAWGKRTPVEFEVANVPEPRVTEVQAHLHDFYVMRRSPCFAEPQRIEREIAERHRLLLQSAVIEIVDTRSALARRRAARLTTGAGDPQDTGDADVPVVTARLVPRRPRGGRRAAAPVSGNKAEA